MRGLRLECGQKGRKVFFFLKEKEAKRTFVRLVSETPIPGGALPPPSVSRKGGRMGFASCGFTEPKRTKVFLLLFLQKKKRLLASLLI
jgi:hypothetical protein